MILPDDQIVAVEDGCLNLIVTFWNYKVKSFIIFAKVFRTRLVFTLRRWTFHEHVNTDEHEHVVRDRPKNVYSNNKRHNYIKINKALCNSF